MKSIAPVRAALGVRTVFNMLGPLTNPAAPPYQLIGAYSLDAARLLADAIAGLPTRRSFVVHGEPGWDEPTPAGPFVLLDVRDGTVAEQRRSAADYGLPACTPESLRGGDAAHNAAALRRVFDGSDRGAHHDALVMGAALVLELTGAAANPLAAAQRAQAALDDGSAHRLLGALAAFGAGAR
jgi:anthranilate phosphoribosyltransferase